MPGDNIVNKQTDLVAENQELRRRIAELERDAADRERDSRQIAENAGAWIWEVDVDGLYTYASPRVRDILGYEPDGLVGKKHFYDFFHPEEFEHLKTAAFEGFAKQEPFKGFVNRNVDRHGRTVWLSTSGVPLFDSAGRLAGYRGLDIDVTELMVVREACRASEERYERVAENAQYMIYRMSIPDGTYEYVSPAAAEITGYSPEEWYRESGLIRQLIHPDWMDYFHTQWQALLDGHMPPSYEYRIIDRAGRERWLYQRNVLVRDSGGKPIAIEGIVSDISERKHAEEALQAAEAAVRRKLNAIIEPDGDIAALALADVLDMESLQVMMEDFFRVTNIPSAILDISGQILMSVGWQDICMRFHRVNQETCRNCLESDTILAQGVEPGAFRLYRCKNNLWDLAAPIMFGERHVGNIFIGQFVPEDAPLDYDVFCEQARRYGFDEKAYIAALDKVPRLSRERANAAMAFLARFSVILSELSYGNMRLARLLSEKDGLLNNLRASEERFRSLVENANDIIYSLSSEGVFTYVSPNWTVWLGHRADEVIGQSFIPFVHPEDVALCVAFLAQVQATGSGSEGSEYRVRHKDGTWRWHSSTGSRVQDADGSYCYMGIARDITEHKRVEDTLRFLMACGDIASGEDFFQSLARYLAHNLDMDFIGIDRLSDDGLTATTLAVYGDGRFHDNIEYRLKGTPCGEVVEKAACSYARDVRHLFPRNGMLQELMAESYIGTTLWSSQGRPIGLIAAISRQPLGDVRVVESILKLAGVRAAGELERRHAEEALLREKALTDAILDSTPGIIYLYDDESRLVRWNKRHEEITGYSPEELYGMALPDWYAGDEKSLAAVSAGIKRTLEHGFGEAEAELQKKDGTRVPMHFTACPLVFGGKTYFVGIGTDISDRRRAEEEKERLQAQLLQAQKTEAVGRLAGGIAHDFNNLLQVILGNVDFLQARQTREIPEQEELAEVRKAAERAAELTGQLLAFGRRQIIRPANIDLNDLIRGMLKMVRRLVGEHIELCFIPSGVLDAVFVDKGQIEQVLMNLCVNARDAMARGGTLTIETGNAALDTEFCRSRPWATAGRYVFIRVTDTGHGMDADTCAHVFDPFFTTKGLGEGTGLGLATVYGIVKQHDGLVHVQSEPGAGTVFNVYLPAVAHVPSKPNERTEAPAVGGTETILVAEDEPAVLALTTQILRTAGYTVLAAANGNEAVRLFEEHAGDIHLVLLDVMMPGLSGRQVMDQILATYPGVQFLFISGYSENAIHTDFVIETGLRLIQKPYRRRELLGEVREILDAQATGKTP